MKLIRGTMTIQVAQQMAVLLILTLPEFIIGLRGQKVVGLGMEDHSRSRVVVAESKVCILTKISLHNS